MCNASKRHNRTVVQHLWQSFLRTSFQLHTEYSHYILFCRFASANQQKTTTTTTELTTAATRKKLHTFVATPFVVAHLAAQRERCMTMRCC